MTGGSSWESAGGEKLFEVKAEFTFREQILLRILMILALLVAEDGIADGVIDALHHLYAALTKPTVKAGPPSAFSTAECICGIDVLVSECPKHGRRG